MKCEKLEVWKKAVALSIEVYKHFSASRDFGFKDQITRSVSSIANNVAEGMEKESLKDQCRFLDIAKGSAAEYKTQVFIGNGVGYISDEIADKWQNEASHILSMLSNLRKHIKSKI